MKLIISTAFFESTIPLANEISKKHDTTLIALHYDRFLTKPNFDLSNCNFEHTKLYDKNQLPKDHYIYRYLENSNLKLKFIILKKSPTSLFFSLFKLFRLINRIKPKLIHFIDFSLLYMPIILFFSKIKIACSLHEFKITKPNFYSFFNSFNLYFSILNYLDSKFLFFSKNVEYDFKNYFPKAKTIVIPFGKFSLYNFCDNSLILTKQKNYILFVGYARNYKGINVMEKAIRILNKKNLNFSFVIAGKNVSNYINSNFENVCVIDKHLSDHEFISLIKNSRAICLPYLKASQSGLPNTCFLFNKPIIASAIKGLDEVISHKYNGLFFKRANDLDLAKKIEIIYKNKELYDSIKKNIISDSRMIKNWSILAQQTTEYCY